jgi:hypothetical protein
MTPSASLKPRAQEFTCSPVEAVPRNLMTTPLDTPVDVQGRALCHTGCLTRRTNWATQGCASLLRSAITFSARRELAAGIRRSTCSGAEAAYVD